ncbi:MAG: GAF domain-containing protein [Anaerolineae bacterium]|nr:GAF domain-containing protein [Anaerolineae bacterium]
MDDKPNFQNTPLAVHKMLASLAASLDFDEVLRQFPNLTLTEIKAGLEYAATLARRKDKATTEILTPLDRRGSNRKPAGLDLKKILVVDDDQANRALIQLIFRESDFTLSMATNGEEGFARALSELPFLIISDIQMPGLDGLELLQQLKANERTQNIGVIFVTAHRRDSRQVSQGLAMGADDYIAMPFKHDEFLARVGAVARLKLAEAEARRQARVVAQRNQGLELVNELALAVNSSLNLQEIFASSMQKLSQLLAAEAVALLLLNEESKELVVNVSFHSGAGISTSVDFSSETKVTPSMLEAQVPLIISDILGDLNHDLSLDFLPQTSVIKCVPMLSKERIIGAIAIVSKQGQDLDETDWVLLNSAVGIIAVAVENASLLQHAQEQVDDLIVLNEIGRALTSTLNHEQILKQTTLLAQRSLQAEATSLWLLDEETQEVVFTASSGIGAEVITGYRLPIHEGLVGYVTRTGEYYLADDVTKDERYFSPVAESINYGPRSMLCVPLRIKDKIIGAMQALHHNVGWFDENHLRLFASVASSVGIAIENARLFAEVQSFSRHLEHMVTERTRELSEEKEKTETILASMADGLLVLDAEKRILTANAVAEGMLNFRLSEWLEKPIGAAQTEHALWRCISEMADNPEPTVSAAVDVPSPQTGAVLSIQAHAAKARNEAGQVVGVVIVLRDITAIKEVERMKSRFMAGVTHELKTPLSVIKLHARNLVTYQKHLPEQKRTELLNSIQAQVQLLEKLIENILELARFDAGTVKIERQPVDLVTLLDQVVADLIPLAQEKRLALHWQKPATEMSVLADPNRLERVIRNLLDNAIKYTPVEGSVEVKHISELREPREFVGFQVSDTGMGIPLEHQLRIFDRFYRVDPSHTIPGTGLGLSIVKEIVNAHGGEVRLESLPGQGSTFVVLLPGREHT